MQISSPPHSASEPLQRYIVSVHDAQQRESLKQELLRIDPKARVTHDLPIIDGFAVETSLDASSKLRGMAARNPGLKVYDDAAYTVPEQPQDGYAPPMGLNSATSTLGLEQMWKAGFTGKGIGIAIIDTGVAKHRDLKDRIIAYKDVQQGVNSPHDPIGHGTHVASIAAGSGRGNARYRGCAPEADIIGVQVFDSSGDTTSSFIIAGIQWAIQNKERYHIRVLNMSLGRRIEGPAKDDPVAQAVEAAVAAGIVPVVAAGNSGPEAGTIKSPANAPDAIAVGAFDDRHTPDPADDRMAAFSSRGPVDYDGTTKPDLVAPGVDIVAANKTSGYTTYSGTSMASPMVAGCVALLLQACPDLGPKQVRELLMRTARPLPGEDANSQGAGVVDPFRAYQSAQAVPVRPSLAAGAAATADVAPPSKPAYVPGQVLVKVSPGVARHAVHAMAQSHGLQVMRQFPMPAQLVRTFGGDLYQFRVTNGDSVEKAVESLSGRPGVLYAEPNYVIQLDDESPKEPVSTTPTGTSNPAAAAWGERRPDDLTAEQWNMRNTGQGGGRPGVDIGATRAWAVQTGQPNGHGPVIAVIDSGVDYNHPDLAANMWTSPHEIAGNGLDDDHNGYVDDIHGANVLRRTGDPMDDNEHGTHCAGIIGAVTDNGTGVAGLNWTATIAGVKMSNQFGSADTAAAVNAILYATSIGARITSNSWGAGSFSQALKDAMAASPALHVCAAGNSAQDNDVYPTYPASFELPNVIAVAAHDRNDQMPHFSNYGDHSVHVAAPGDAITSTLPGGGYGQRRGTSMATPHVAGVAGLIVSEFPDITNEQLIARLMGTAVKAPAYAGRTISGGRVDAAAALRHDAMPPDMPRDFRVSRIGSNQVTLEWTETGDDGMRGQAWRYEVRVSDRPITGERGWQEARPLAAGTPGAPGSPEKITCTLPPENGPRTCYFALKIRDGVGNPSTMTATSGVGPAASVVFEDDMESDAGGWTAQGGWARVRVPGHGMAYTDSPGGPYAKDANTWIVSRPIDLRKCRNPVLKLDEKHDFEANMDFCHLEISDNGGKKWHEVARYTGSEDWRTRVVDLKAFEGRSIQVRFRVTSDGAMQKDGIYIDQVQVSGDPA